MPGTLITLTKGMNEEDNEIYSQKATFLKNKLYAKKKKNSVLTPQLKNKLIESLLCIHLVFFFYLPTIYTFWGFSFIFLIKRVLHYT